MLSSWHTSPLCSQSVCLHFSPNALWQQSARLNISSLSFCQFWSVIIKYPIFLLFCLLLLFACVAAFCAPTWCKSRDSFLMLKALRNSRENKGNTMKNSSLFLVVINTETPTFLLSLSIDIEIQPTIWHKSSALF